MSKQAKRKRSVIHVVWSSRYGWWIVRFVKVWGRDGKLRLVESVPWSTKSAAVEYARDYAKGCQPSSLLIHRKDGRFQEERSYGSDPRRYKG